MSFRKYRSFLPFPEWLFYNQKDCFMENSFNDELYCSLKDELREVNAQIDVHSEQLMNLLDQKKELSVN